MKMNKKGFTLIELLIVVAIIAILAAIAIPQFSAYRIRGYNAASDSDLRNIKIAEEAFYTDNQVYASTVACAAPVNYADGTGTGVPGAGNFANGPATYTINVALASINAAGNLPSAASKMVFGLSNGVTATILTAALGVDYAIFAAHTSGDVIFAGESGVTTLFKAGKDAAGAVVAVSSANQKAGGTLSAKPAGATQLPANDLPAAANAFVAI
jgi:type IV pilus assembly protein PilA